MVQLGTSFHPWVLTSLILDLYAPCTAAVQPGTRGRFGASARPAASTTLLPVQMAPVDCRSIVNIHGYPQQKRARFDS